MITDIYHIDEGDSIPIALDGLERAARFCEMGDAPISRLRVLANALIRLSKGLEQVSNTQLWMETKPGEAILRLKADCVIDITEEDELKKLSTSGKNTERKGFFEKIRGFFSEMAISQNEELVGWEDLGYMPGPEYELYPVHWTFTPVYREHWNKQAAADVRYLASSVDVGFSSTEVEIAAHMKY